MHINHLQSEFICTTSKEAWTEYASQMLLRQNYLFLAALR